jgi:D-glycero-beta-D-manno-heptose 1-phosphate adenylyltransferase
MLHYNRIEKKIVDVITLNRMIHVWRLQSKTIVFTNGVYDILHCGHIHLLAAARDFGDVLIVGLNADASVSRIKPGRPLQDEHTRAIVMASITLVDAVVLFNEDTPYELIKAIQPDVLVKGGDYKPEIVVGADVVKARGGKVEIVPLLEGFSTTAIEQKIKKQ